MIDVLITLSITILLIVVTVVPYFKRVKKKEAKAKEKFNQLKISGLHEAKTMHPQIDLLKCIGCAACVKACPEGDVLGIIDGKATLIHGAKCVGHGLCAEACPVEGINLLMAKPGRNANLPILFENFETSVKGIFIAGELSGLALIKNATIQGINAIKHISTLLKSKETNIFDVAIIGSGPAGFAAGLKSLEQKLNYLILEQNDFGGTVLQYPRAKIVMTSPIELPLWGKIKLTETRKEALLELWEEIIKKTGLKINTGVKINDIKKVNGHFKIFSETSEWDAKYIVLALGRRGTPRKLGVRGENLSKVTYRLIDAASYQNIHALVVGGGDSAIEAAIGLATQNGNTVTLSYRKNEFTKIKERNKIHIDEFILQKKIKVEFSSEVEEISETMVSLKTLDGNKEIKNDFVFIFAGGEMPNEFLQKIGVELQSQQVN